MTNLRDYDRDATLIEKVRDLEQQLADARASLDIAYAKGYDIGCALERARIRKAILNGSFQHEGLNHGKHS